MDHQDALGQPVGAPLGEWTPPPQPPRTPLVGRSCRLEPFDLAAHGEALHAAYVEQSDDRDWTYLGYGPFADRAAFLDWAAASCVLEDPLFHTILTDGTPTGVASLMRIQPAIGVIEIGHIHLAPALQRTRAASEALILLMKRAFALGYRRLEWKCDALNAPSRRAALRLGFRYEGTFRQALHYKGRNRDTAWFAIIDADWPALEAVLDRWLDDANFDASGAQRASLSGWTAELS